MNKCDMEQDLRNKVLIFSGSAHPALAQEIADYLGLPLNPTLVRKFTNDNFYVQLGVSVRAKEVFIVQPISPPCSDNLLELCFMLDIARSAGAAGVHAVIPYYSYARSDKKDAPRISIGARLIADLLVTAGATQVTTMTLHSPQVHGFFSIPTDHLTAHSVFLKHFRQQDLSNAVIVSPDIGHAKRALKLAQALGLPAAAGKKRRLSDNRVIIDGMMGDVRGKRVLLVDDEIATGGTIIEVIKYLRKEEVTRVTVLGTHGLFTGRAVEQLNAIDEIEEIVITDTVPLPEERKPARLKVLSVAHIFGEVTRCNVLGQSVGNLFEFWPVSNDV
ncbi:MAG: ribose-phosphate pyrophosphokinase [Chloroflexota bacterium]|nr:ribose-phosphate pyrophosphokinase [Chloroflexota bacterium]